MSNLRPPQFSLRRMMVWVMLLSLFAFVATSFVRWMSSRPGEEVTNYVGEIADIKKALGDDAVQELRIWHLYSWELYYLWTAKMPPEAIGCLKKSLHLVPVAQSRLPPAFWNVPPELSESPSWWKPKPTADAEYYMSPSFLPEGSTIDNDSDGAVMYDPVEKRVWVWSHFDF